MAGCEDRGDPLDAVLRAVDEVGAELVYLEAGTHGTAQTVVATVRGAMIDGSSRWGGERGR